MDTTDCIVIGAGVVGLAIARHLAMSGREVIVLEKENAIAMHSSSRNSEVIHAGIYYSPGSLKAKLCVQGRSMLYEFCEKKGVAHQRVGKLIVATQQGQIAALARLHLNGQTNGVGDLRMLEAEEAQRMEPAVRGVGAMLSPSTGIVDSHGLILAMQGDFEDAGGMLALKSIMPDGGITSGRITAVGRSIRRLPEISPGNGL